MMRKLARAIRKGIASELVGRPGSEDGQGLAYVLIIGAVLLVFLTALVNVLVQEERWIVGTSRRSQLITAGDGAVDRAMYKIQKEGNWDTAGQGLVTGYHQDVIYTDQPGLRYTIQIQDGNWTPVDSAGNHYMIGNDKTERTITVRLSNTKTGEKKKIQVVVIQTVLNSAIFSGGQINVGGSADAHWGPVVSYSTASDSIPFPKGTLPGHPIFMSAGGITFNGVAAEYTVPVKYSPVPMAGVSVYSNDKALGPQPEFDTFAWKQQANTGMKGGYGFYDNGGGTCTWNGGVPPSMLADQTVVFYDTCNGNTATPSTYNPSVNTVCKGSCSGNAIGADVTLTGNWCGQGTLVVMGNLDTKGTGCSMALTMTPPTDCYPKFDNDTGGCQAESDPTLLWNGFIYVAGALSSSGNKKVYGTIYAYDTAGITGNFSIWYKSNNNQLGTLGKTVFTKIWMERKPLGTDTFP